jgi:hypothetical protein
MQTETSDICPTEAPPLIAKQTRLAIAARDIAAWLSAQLALPDARTGKTGPQRSTIALLCASLFFIALGVRGLHRQDSQAELVSRQTMMRGLMPPYAHEAQRMLAEGRVLFPQGETDAGNARMLVHPPGYALFLAALIKTTRDAAGMEQCAQIVQMTGDSLAVLCVFFIAAELLPLAIAAIAGGLVAFSPHLAYYSLYLSPDSLAVLPVLMAVYLILRARRRPRLWLFIAAGALIGVSCWLRSNGILLAPFLAVIVWMMYARGPRWRYSLALVGATVIIIAPITIRNWVIYHRFIPLTVASGLNLVQGIAEFDREKRFGMPLGDGDAKLKDIEWHNNPEYAQGLWQPDGIERDRYRFARGLEVMRQHPVWFAGAMVRRAGFMLSYNDSRAHDWPFYTAVVPPVAAEPAFGHWRDEVVSAPVVQTYSPIQALSAGATLSPQAEVALIADGATFEVRGDPSEFGNQFVFPPIQVEKHTDYAVQFPARLVQGKMAAKVTSSDYRIALASTLIANEPHKKNKQNHHRKPDPSATTGEQPATLITLRFASGNRTEVRLVLSNNEASTARPTIDIGEARVLMFGPTPQQWTRAVRPLVRGMQKNLYTTARMLPLIIIGIALLIIARRWSALLLLLAVPVYYVCSHAAFSTEYRYVLAIHYFLFITAATTLYCFAMAIKQSAQWAFNIKPVRELEKQEVGTSG